MAVRFTSAEIDDARHLIVLQFARMGRENRVGLYRSTARAIKVAADELVIRRMLAPELADVAVPATIEWVAQRAARAPATDGEATR
jgi:hypothetical protein